MSKDLIEKTLNKKLIYKGKFTELFCDEVQLPNGNSATREYINHPGAAAVLPFIDKENIVLVKQYRYAIGKVTYEIPAGKIDAGETPIECITRELEEETGYIAKKFELLLSFYPTSALSNELLHIFSAFNLEEGNFNPDEDEFVEKEIVNFKNALDMIKDGQIKDSKTIISLLYFSSLPK
ncbi:NUDIX domain-containing protein [Candidatus Endomicrobiellum devescovinae]|jgi:ADP-ribose pyrophosphatase|uniref:NUDIX domain-containing protein n=1 Tax=Candidatus Endomicrobiellum devescovinae TaxID=3242322 RepID=UPI00283234DC|nr:NUDIX hydrolase [Endomicrobium sp.]MDR1434523.1 NUDIX hydrolase [Endomicrobium sp.]